MRTVRITDDELGGSVTVADHDIAEAITPWFPDASAEVREVIQRLEDRVLRGEDTSAEETYLLVTVTHNPPKERQP